MIRINPITMDVEIVKRDTGVIPVRPYIKDTNDYILQDGATLYFTLRKTKESDILLRKETTEFEDGWGVINIDPSDTADLEEGTYIYDLVAIRADGTRDTLLPRGRDSLYFAIKKGVKQWQ